MNRLKEIREAKGFTQQELADKAGVAVQTVNRLELGRRRPHGMTIRIFAHVLGVNAEELKF